MDVAAVVHNSEEDLVVLQRQVSVSDEQFGILHREPRLLHLRNAQTAEQLGILGHLARHGAGYHAVAAADVDESARGHQRGQRSGGAQQREDEHPNEVNLMQKMRSF